MSAFESSYKSLLQGVSQQIPKERLPGQVSAQLNMMSDPVTNLRRRPGTQFVRSDAFGTVDPAKIKTWFTDISGERCHVALNCLTGVLRLYDPEWNILHTYAAQTYLQALPRQIQAASVGNEFFLCNTEVTPSTSGSLGGPDPAQNGFFYVVAGSFSRAYTVTITWNGGTNTYSYTTPSGTTAGDAALSTPEYIAQQLVNAIVAGGIYGVSVVSSYVHVSKAAATSFTVNTSSGSSYMVASKDLYLPQASMLPAQLPSTADGMLCRIGALELPQYYKYVHSKTSWLESGAYGSPTSIINMPISIFWTGTAWGMGTAAFEGRLAGDVKSNPNPAFIDYGITGISTCQGRFVILAGPQVCMSSTDNPRRFYRSTITSLIDSDTIGVGSAMNNSAAYRHAIPFQKDLLLFSESYQALVPTGNTALTPRTATVLPTSGHEVDTTAVPIVIGRTVMYSSPRSETFFGVMELAPSPYTDSQYVSQDATPHLPKYMGGRCRFSVASSIAGMALFAPSGDSRSLIVYEYMWDGDNKVQQAWHTWTFEYPVASAHFAFDKIVIVHAQNGQLLFSTIDPKAGALTFDAGRKPFMDLWHEGTVAARSMDVRSDILLFDPTFIDRLSITNFTGALAGEHIGSTKVDANTIETVRSFEAGTVAVGITYQSLFSPTQPQIRDQNDVVISTNKATLLRFLLGTKNSSQFVVTVFDTNTEGTPEEVDNGTLTWSSQELELGRGLYSTDAVSIIPCRTNAATTMLEVSTSGHGELNLTSLEYVMRYNQKIRRR